jgi:hypothetical protein
MICPYCKKTIERTSAFSPIYSCFDSDDHNYMYYVGMHYFKLIANNCSIEKIDDNVSFNGSLIQLDIDVNHNNCLEILNHLKRLIVFS